MKMTSFQSMACGIREFFIEPRVRIVDYCSVVPLAERLLFNY